MILFRVHRFFGFFVLLSIAVLVASEGGVPPQEAEAVVGAEGEIQMEAPQVVTPEVTEEAGKEVEPETTESETTETEPAADAGTVEEVEPTVEEPETAETVEEPVMEETTDEREPVQEEAVVEEEVSEPAKEEPVVEEKEPDVEEKEPVVEKKEPVVEKVVEKKEPVVEKKEPVVEKKEPVVEKKEPVVEKKEPVADETKTDETADDANCPSRTSIINCSGKYLDTDQDGKLSAAELDAAIKTLPWWGRGILKILGSTDKMMQKCDIDKDGFISMDYDMVNNGETCLATCFKRRAFKSSFFPDCDL